MQRYVLMLFETGVASFFFLKFIYLSIYFIVCVLIHMPYCVCVCV